MSNPFYAAVRSVQQAHDAVALIDELQRLALIVRAAHEPSDVWAGCRVERALRMHRGEPGTGALSSWLHGRHFGEVDSDCLELSDLEELREYAIDFLDGKGRSL